MKSKQDILTIAVVIFCTGVFASSVGLTQVFETKPKPPTALQQGISAR